MTLVAGRKYARSGRIGRYRPTPERPFPSLGWGVLDFTYRFLPSPANEKEPLIFTHEQASRIIEWFRLVPETGQFVHNRRLHLQEAKGFGKSPFAGALDIADFKGPVCFDGWDAYGQPVGVEWGVGDRPSPWIQIAAVSEGQTKNTYAAIYAMLSANDHKAARDLRIDDGRTRLYSLDHSDAIVEFVTASAGSREGQRVTKATLDEPQLWVPGNGGHLLADTILGNLTKMNGRAVFTGNAYIGDQNSVAERFDFDEPGVLRYGRRPTEEPERDWPRERLRKGLEEVYADAWWIDLDRLVDDATSPSANWPRMKRLFWNIPAGADENTWMPEESWDECEGKVALDEKLPTYVNVAIDHDHRAAAVAIAQRQGNDVVVKMEHFLDDDILEGDYLDLGDVEKFVLGLQEHFPTRVMAAKRMSPRSPERLYAAKGPEVAYHGTFFERSAQGLKLRGLVLVDIPHTRERLTPAAEQLMELVTAGRLVHDGDPELARQIGRCRAKEVPKGWILIPPASGARIVAARAAIMAVHRAMTAPRTPSRTISWRPPR